METDLNRRAGPHEAAPPISQDPLFSPSTLRFRSSSRPKGRKGIDLFWARNAIYHGLRALGIGRGHSVLVPAYLCSAAIEPIEHADAEVEFYEIQKNCEPDWADLERRIHSRTKAIMAVHYFGFPSNMERFCALRERYNLLLIEDCAHVMEGVPSQHHLGELGDFSVFSPRKFLSVFDGGRLVFNRPAPDFRVRLQFESALFTLRAAKNLWERRTPSSGLPVGPQFLQEQGDPATPDRPAHLDRPAPDRPAKPRFVFPNSTSFLPWMAGFPMSRLSRLLLRRFPLEDIASKRRANYSYLMEKIARIGGVRPAFEQLAPDVVPWVLPVMIGETAEAHLALRAMGIPAVTWGGVRDKRISAAEFPQADFLYEHLLFLPIHQDLGREHLDFIAEAVATVCR